MKKDRAVIMIETTQFKISTDWKNFCRWLKRYHGSTDTPFWFDKTSVKKKSGERAEAIVQLKFSAIEDELGELTPRFERIATVIETSTDNPHVPGGVKSFYERPLELPPEAIKFEILSENLGSIEIEAICRERRALEYFHQLIDEAKQEFA